MTDDRDLKGLNPCDLMDAEAGRLNTPATDDVLAWLDEKVPDAVTWSGWQAIDAHEVAAGEPQSRPRVKLVRVPEMLAVAERVSTPA